MKVVICPPKRCVWKGWLTSAVRNAQAGRLKGQVCFTFLQVGFVCDLIPRQGPKLLIYCGVTRNSIYNFVLELVQ
jgi:hypothetical protein